MWSFPFFSTLIFINRCFCPKRLILCAMDRERKKEKSLALPIASTLSLVFILLDTVIMFRSGLAIGTFIVSSNACSKEGEDCNIVDCCQNGERRTTPGSLYCSDGVCYQYSRRRRTGIPPPPDAACSVSQEQCDLISCCKNGERDTDPGSLYCAHHVCFVHDPLYARRRSTGIATAVGHSAEDPMADFDWQSNATEEAVTV